MRRFIGLIALTTIGCGSTPAANDAGKDVGVADDGVDAASNDATEEVEIPDGGLDAAPDSPDAATSCVESIIVSADHTCALKKNGTLWCWGKNEFGQLGDGSMTGKSTPQQVANLGNTVVEVSAGDYHTCARKMDGTAWCWGHNGASQATGDGNTTTRVIPGQVMALGSSVAQIAAYSYNTCARKNDGTLWCWGANGAGAVGIGTTSNSVMTPTQVSVPGNQVAEVSGGLNHACARKSDNTVWCWGDNTNGVIGDGTFKMGTACGGDCKPSPVQALITSVAQISAGQNHTCARKSDGSVWCWGWNLSGSLGDGTMNSQATPTKVMALGNAGGVISAGNAAGCARKTDGTLWCWGQNGWGALGDGTTADRLTPVQIMGVGNTVTSFAIARRIHSCAVSGASVYCWGDNRYGQLGTGTPGGQSFCQDMTKNCELTPVLVKGLCP